MQKTRVIIVSVCVSRFILDCAFGGFSLHLTSAVKTDVKGANYLFKFMVVLICWILRVLSANHLVQVPLPPVSDQGDAVAPGPTWARARPQHANSSTSGSTTPACFWPEPLSIPPDLEDCPDVPASFRCPITYEIMREPAVALSGHTYEREVRRLHFCLKHGSSARHIQCGCRADSCPGACHSCRWCHGSEPVHRVGVCMIEQLIFCSCSLWFA